MAGRGRSSCSRWTGDVRRSAAAGQRGHPVATGRDGEASSAGTASPGRRLVLVFLDGVGIGEADPSHNPFFRARLPWLEAALGRLPSLDHPTVLGGEACAFPVDARLDVAGTPQSGTGQTTLLTGYNAARLFGRHFGPWTPVSLRPLLERENLLVRALRQGIPTAFANAYPEGWPGRRSTRRLAAPPLAARAAGLLTRHAGHLVRGEAVASDIDNALWRRHLGPPDLPRVSPEQAGAHLARIVRGHRFTFFAHYATDYAGHRGGMDGSVQALERVDAFLAGLRTGIADSATLVVLSDHGNVEDVRTGHTLNPALGLAAGPGAADLARTVRGLPDVAGAVLSWLGAATGPGPPREGGEVDPPA